MTQSSSLSSPASSSSSSSSLSLDLARIRAQFPALARQHGGHPVAYFDGPGGTQVPRGVVDAISDYLFHHNANTHWSYPTSAETDAIILGARGALAAFLNASADEIVFGANMTTLTFHLARALARKWQPGDELIVTELDHHANVDSWRAAAADRGLTVKTIRVQSPSGELDFDELAAAFSARTKLLAIGAASNAIGTMVDLPRAIALARKAGALVFVDAVHFAPHSLVDVRALDCDFLGCSTYKFYGPHMGVLYGKRALIEALDAPKLRPAPDESPERLETGTQNHEAIAGAAAAVDFLASLATGTLPSASDRRAALQASFEAMHAEGDRRLAQLWNGLANIPGVTLYGRQPGQPRTPTVAFTVAGHDSGKVAEALATRGVFVSNGNFYAQTLVERLGHSGAGGLVRAGCACYTTEEEVARLIAGVEALAR
jgi:cysteine desulfurase family protein (TIGR01976 family)